MAVAGISILQRLIDPDRGDFTADVARYFLSIDFTPEQQARYEALSDRAAQGALSSVEADELDEFLAANALLTALQSKARIALRLQTLAA